MHVPPCPDKPAQSKCLAIGLRSTPLHNTDRYQTLERESVNRHRTVLFGCILIACSVPPTHAAPTLTNLTENLPQTAGNKYAMPHINNLGQVGLVRSITSGEGGAPYFWNGSGDPVAVPGVQHSSGNSDLRFNDLDQFVYTNTSDAQVIVADPGGLVHLFDDGLSTFRAGINNAGTVIRVATTNGFYYNAWVSEYSGNPADPYPTDVPVYPGGADYHLTYPDINNTGQVMTNWFPNFYVWDYDGITVSNQTFIAGNRNGPARNLHFNDKGQLLARGINADVNTLLLNEQPIYTGQLVRHWLWQPNPNYSKWLDTARQVGMSDDGSKVVWCEWVGEVNPANGSMDIGNWDAFTFIDGIPTNITQGSLPAPYQHVMDPSVNNQGQIVFAARALGDDLTSYTGDVFLWEDDELTDPTVYNGHFNGDTLFGWDITGPGTASTTMLGIGDYASQLTAGSPVSISQLIDTPGLPFTLDFLFDFQTPTGTLDVTLDGQLLASLTAADDTEPGFTALSLDVTAPALLGLADAELVFIFDGDTGSAVLLDNVLIIPEAGGWVLMGLGVTALLHRRRDITVWVHHPQRPAKKRRCA